MFARITKAYPTLDSLILNAGIQRTFDFLHPAPYAEMAAKMTSEIATNYTSPLLTITAFLPHLLALAPRPASIILVTSVLALVPLPRCGPYCATKAGLHALAWSLRAQLAAGGAAAAHLRVVDVLPPAVRTELHELQPEMVTAGMADVGMPLGQYIDETWDAMNRWDPDEHELLVAESKKHFGHVEDARREAFVRLQEMVKAMGSDH